MKSFFKLGLALLVGCLVIGSADDLFAQEVARGILEGVVWDQDKNPVEGAIITLTGPQGVRSQVTDSYGRYQFRDLIPGEYSVKAESEGRATVVQTAVDVSIGMRTQLPFMLSAGVDETIEVVSEAPVVDLKSTAVGALISTEDLVQRIPLGRNFAQMFTLSPGVSTGLAAGAGNFSVSGSTGLENSYLIDGVNVTNSGYGGIGSYNRVFGSLGTGVTNDFIEQVEIKEGGFEAEFGQATGGVMNAVVKSGTNDFQGGLSVYLEPGSMESPRRLFANNPESVTVNETDTQDFALDLGGPIIQDKLFWFAAVNPVSTETEFTRLVEDESILFDSLGNLIDPAQPSGGRTETRERTSTNWAAKVSWFVTPNHRIELTGFGDPSDGDFGPQRRTSLSRIGSEGFSELDYGGESYSIKYFGAITSDLFVDAIF
ncbi:MAG: TonB-dependent receptor, partial [Acidobacteriota bacterium]